MITAQVTLPDRIYKSLKRRYGAKGKQPKDVIRDALIQSVESGASTTAGNRTLDKLANLRLKGGPSNLVSHLDDYLYGNKA